MAFTIAGLISDGPIALDNSECVRISFPEFFNCIEKIEK
jgi:5-enolpyruvylshikimate-3-phosphate synthase